MKATETPETVCEHGKDIVEPCAPCDEVLRMLRPLPNLHRSYNLIVQHRYDPIALPAPVSRAHADALALLGLVRVQGLGPDGWFAVPDALDVPSVYA